VNLINLVELGFIALFFIVLMGFALVIRKRPERRLREIPAFARLGRSIGLAVEAGKRVHVSLGYGGVNDIPGASGMVGLTMLQRIARAASLSDQPPIASSGEGALGILSQDTLRSAYQAIRSENSYDPIYGQITGLTPLSYAAGTLPIIFDQQVSTSVLAGHFGTEVALIVDANERSGNQTMAGSDSLDAQAIMYATTPDPLIGEELYAGGAYLNAGLMHQASLRTQDAMRWIIIFGIIVGSLLKLMGVIP
jgi:hypothetical protein